AAANGIVRYPTMADLERDHVYLGGDPDVFNVLELVTSNGYRIYYLHLSNHPRTISIHLTDNTKEQNFLAIPRGPSTHPAKPFPAFQPPVSGGLRLSGRITTLQGIPVSGVVVELRGYVYSRDKQTRCPAGFVVTDNNGNYTFSGLLNGYYHIR